MATLTYWLKINDVEVTKIKKFQVEQNKLWTDADRNMAGSLTATLIGIFPKINIETTYLTNIELRALLPLLNLASSTIIYWDEETETYLSGAFYSNDFTISYFDKVKGLYEPITFSLIPFEKK